MDEGSFATANFCCSCYPAAAATDWFDAGNTLERFF